MTTVLITLGVLVAAAILASRLAVRSRVFLVTAILVLPVALTLPRTLRHERRVIDRSFALTPVEAEVVPPIHWPAYENVSLLLGIRRLVPRGASISFIPGGRWTRERSPAEARRIYVQSGWVRWVAFVVAPRIVVPGRDAPWVVLVDQSPADAGLHPRRAWRFDRDWLVRR